jgi:release factor glutamine methyltransferase
MDRDSNLDPEFHNSENYETRDPRDSTRDPIKADPTIAALKKRIHTTLLEAGIEESECRRETDLIVEHVTGWKLAEQILKQDEVVQTEALEKIDAIVAKRQERVPLYYCFGSAWFMGMEMLVTQAVLIPRPETEVLVEVTLQLLKHRKNPVLVDIGTGSGAIAIALAKFRPDAKVYAVDISGEALEVARANASKNSVADRVHFFEGDWLRFKPDELLDAVVSNPPYVPKSLAAELQPEVSVFEPEVAVFGSDEDGLGFFRSLSINAGKLLASQGLITLELGAGQSGHVLDIFKSGQWTDLEVHSDLSQIPRVMSAAVQKSGF